MKRQACSGSKLIDTMIIIFMKDCFAKNSLKKKSADDKNPAKIIKHAMLKLLLLHQSFKYHKKMIYKCM